MIQVELIHKNAKMPTRRTSGSAGLDLYSVVEMNVRPKSRVLIPTGIVVAIPHGQGGFIWSRSKLACKKLVDVKAGVVDSDYRGEVMVLIQNDHPHDYFPVSVGDRIGQLIVQFIDDTEPMQVSKVNEPLYKERGKEGILSEDLRL